MLVTDAWITKKSSVRWTKLHSWQVGLSHSVASRLATSEGKNAAPATSRREAWYLLAVEKKVAIRVPKLTATQLFKGLCSRFTVIEDASWCFRLNDLRAEVFSSGRNKGFYFAREPGDSETAEFGTAKSPANCSLLVRVTYSVAPILGVLTAPSVMIHNWSSGRGRAMQCFAEKADWARWKDVSFIRLVDPFVIQATYEDSVQ